MKTLNRVLSLVLFVSAAAFAQTALTQTTTSAAALATDKIISLTSTTGVTGSAGSSALGTALFIISPGNNRGELVYVQTVNTTANTVTVARGRSGQSTAIPSGARVLIGTPAQFGSYDPAGGCTAANTTVTPFVNVKNGLQWLCSSVTSSWVPGWGNTTAPAQPTASVAAAAAQILPTGPLFHVTGSNVAVTGFTVPVGFVGSTITVIPDTIFTTTTANNIGLASTAAVGKAIIFTYDAATAKFYPSY